MLQSHLVKDPIFEHSLIMALVFVCVWAAHTIMLSPKSTSAVELSQETTFIPEFSQEAAFVPELSPVIALIPQLTAETAPEFAPCP